MSINFYLEKRPNKVGENPIRILTCARIALKIL